MNYLNVGRLEGRLVRLEPLDKQHIDDLVKAASDGRGAFSLTDVPASREDMATYVLRALQERKMSTALPFAVVDLRSQTIVGSTRFVRFEFWRWPKGTRPRPAGKPDAVEIGYTWLSSRAQRTGINREAKLLMLEVAFERWSMSRVSLRTDARNVRSRAAIEGIGATLDGVLRSAQAGYDGAIRDTAAYSIIASEWPRVRVLLESSLARRT